MVRRGSAGDRGAGGAAVQGDVLALPDRGDGALQEGGRLRRPPPRGHAVPVPAGQALLQSFPKTDQFVPKDDPIYRKIVGRLIGNAVPVRLGAALSPGVVPVFATFLAALSSSDSRHFHRLPRTRPGGRSRTRTPAGRRAGLLTSTAIPAHSRWPTFSRSKAAPRARDLCDPDWNRVRRLAPRFGFNEAGARAPDIGRRR